MPLALRCHGGPPSSVSTLSALGLAREEERLYQRLLPLSGREVEVVAAGLRIGAGELRMPSYPNLSAWPTSRGSWSASGHWSKR
jgi:hypothetical protein